jgi:hypothetical protein
MNFRTLILGAVIATLVLQGGGRRLRSEQLQGEVRGVVSDLSGGRIRGAVLKFDGEEHEKDVQTAEDGTYKVELKPGKYQVLVSETGFIPGKRSAFILVDGAKVEVNFELEGCTIADGYTIDANGHAVPFSKCVGELEQEELNEGTASRARPLLRFGKREERESLIVYSGLLRERPEYGIGGQLLDPYKVLAVLTYDLTTIKARTFTYSRRDRSISGMGSVVWEDGKNTRHGSEIEVNFGDAEPEVKLVQ